MCHPRRFLDGLLSRVPLNLHTTLYNNAAQIKDVHVQAEKAAVASQTGMLYYFVSIIPR